MIKKFLKTQREISTRLVTKQEIYYTSIQTMSCFWIVFTASGCFPGFLVSCFKHELYLATVLEGINKRGAMYSTELSVPHVAWLAGESTSGGGPPWNTVWRVVSDISHLQHFPTVSWRSWTSIPSLSRLCTHMVHSFFPHSVSGCCLDDITLHMVLVSPETQLGWWQQSENKTFCQRTHWKFVLNDTALSQILFWLFPSCTVCETSSLHYVCPMSSNLLLK